MTICSHTARNPLKCFLLPCEICYLDTNRIKIKVQLSDQLSITPYIRVLLTKHKGSGIVLFHNSHAVDLHLLIATDQDGGYKFTFNTVNTVPRLLLKKPRLLLNFFSNTVTRLTSRHLQQSMIKVNNGNCQDTPHL